MIIIPLRKNNSINRLLLDHSGSFWIETDHLVSDIIMMTNYEDCYYSEMVLFSQKIRCPSLDRQREFPYVRPNWDKGEFPLCPWTDKGLI